MNDVFEYKSNQSFNFLRSSISTPYTNASFGFLYVNNRFDGTEPSATTCSIGLKNFLPKKPIDMFSPDFGYNSNFISELNISVFL